MNKARILLKEHDGVVKQLLVSSFINEIVASLENRIVLNTVTKILQHRGQQLFVFYVYSKTEVVKFPSTVNVKIISNFSPVLVDGIY